MNKISVLFVCLGNICRSPAAEAIFISLLKKKELTDGFIVDSAGTGSWHIGKKADSRMRIAAERRDINILSEARQITSKDFDEFNYILAMDDSNFINIHSKKTVHTQGVKKGNIVNIDKLIPIIAYLFFTMVQLFKWFR